MEKELVEAVTLTVAAAVDPTAVAVKVAVPTPPAKPVTEVVNLPWLSVTPDAGLSATKPVPVVAMLIGAPGTPVPTAFLAMKTTVAGEVPSSGTEAVAGENKDSVEPEIWIGIWAVALPAVAVTVAVRLARLSVPDRKVKVAVPLESVVTVWLLNTPVSAANVTTTPGTAAFDELSAVTVTVVVAELSEGTAVGLADSVISAAVGVLVVAVVVVVTPLAPQLANKAVIAANMKAVKDLA